MEFEKENDRQFQCRRVREDRRLKNTPLLSKYTFVGKRRGKRRDEDFPKGYYVDRPQKEIVFLICMIGLLCLLDGLLTIYHMKKGAMELNPIMNYYLKMGNEYFFLFKMLITVPALFFLLLHQNFFYIKKVIYYIGILYSLVIVYHLALFVYFA